MSTTVKVNLDSVQTILSKRGLEPGGKAQRFMTSEIKRLSDPYTPFDNGILKSNVTMEANSITYNVPYARYMYYGISKGGKDIKYQGSPRRGKLWVERAMIDRKQDVINAVNEFIKRG